MVNLVDCVVGFRAIKDLLKISGTVRAVLQTAKTLLKLSKCSFLEKAVSYKAETSGQKTVPIHNKNCEEVHTSLARTDQSEFRPVLGICSVHRHSPYSFVRAVALSNVRTRK